MTEEVKNKIERKSKIRVNSKQENKGKVENRTKTEKTKSNSENNVKKTTKRPYNKRMVRNHEGTQKNQIFKKSKLKIIPLRRDSRNRKKYYSF